MKDLSLSPAQSNEWLAWRSFCRAFYDSTGCEINDDKHDQMVKAIKRWGEELVVLREEHPMTFEVLERMRLDAPIKLRRLA